MIEQKRLEESFDLVSDICGFSSLLVSKIIDDNEDVTIFIKEDSKDEANNPLYSLCVFNNKNFYKVALPFMPHCSLLSSFFANRAAYAQKIIDTFVDVLKDSILQAQKIVGENFEVKVEDTCIYKHAMVWINNDEDFHYYVHPYLKEKHPDAYEEVKKYYENYIEDEILEKFFVKSVDKE